LPLTKIAHKRPLNDIEQLELFGEPLMVPILTRSTRYELTSSF